MARRLTWPVLIVLAVAIAVGAALRPRTWRVEIRPSLEELLPDGSPYNPNTQSFVRPNHWLEDVAEASIRVDRSSRATVTLRNPDDTHHLLVRNLPIDWIVPRLHYTPASPPDAFDAFNLMLAEYSRNSLSVPVGKASDEMPHFETDTPEAVPWTLAGDYDFVPNPLTRPIRFSLVNNCLAPGLWELIAKDRTGEIYHAWFDMPKNLYHELIARANGIDPAWAGESVRYRTEPVPLRLERLRTVVEDLGTTPCAPIEDHRVGYSSQDSRRKLRKHYVEIARDGQWTAPDRIDDLTRCSSRFSNFIEPGFYSTTDRKTFDFTFLRKVSDARVARVRPLTHFNWRSADRKDNAHHHVQCVELTLNLEGAALIIGNLPLELLVPQEDFAINGFGVGILSSGGLAERRRYLIESGPPPSYAYLCKPGDTGWHALNSHDFGLEQIFIRTHVGGDDLWWEITLTSYERIVDIIKYRVDVPAGLRDALRKASVEYVSPLYRTYRDDNIR